MSVRDEDGGSAAGETAFDLLRPYRRLVLATFLGWFLDAFDQVSLLLVLPDIGASLHANLAAMGLVIAAQSIGRVVGNVGWGWLADRYGRKLTFMAGVVLFAACSGLTALAWSYFALLVIQFVFGIGFGGEWTASASLLMESVPARARSLASAVMMTGYEVGFFAAAGMQALLLPHFGWRALFVVGIAPALLAIFIRRGVDESPVWLKQRENAMPHSSQGRQGDVALPNGRWPLLRNLATLQACMFMAAVQFTTAAIYSFYPTLLKTSDSFSPTAIFAAIGAYSVGSVLGKVLCGLAATRLGARLTILICIACVLLLAYPFTRASTIGLAMLVAFCMGGCSSGLFALVPFYLSVRFANVVRSFGMGLAYAVAAAGQSVASYLVPKLGHGFGLAEAITVCAFGAALVVAAVVAFEPSILPGRDIDDPAVAS